MDITLTEGPGHLLLRVSGALTVRTAGDLRDMLFKAVVEQPRGVVCDLREMTAVPIGLTVLHVVADQVAEWPGTPMALVAHERELVNQLHVLGIGRRLPVAPDVEHAAEALRHAPGFVVASTLLPPNVDAPAAARGFVTTALTHWRAEAAVDAGRWVVSELVTNVVLHTGTESTVRVSMRRRRVGLSVGDRGRGGIRRPAEPGRDGGWGLAVVGRLTRSSGVLPRQGAGWVVWTVLDAGAAPPGVLPQPSSERV